MLEYGLLLAFIAIVCTLAVTALGTDTKNLFPSADNCVNGTSCP